MKFKIKWDYKNIFQDKLYFTSEWINNQHILAIIEDVEKTGRVRNIEIEDETGLTWTKKELKKLLIKLETEPNDITLYFDASFHKGTGMGGLGAVLYYRLGKDYIRHRWNEKIDYLVSNNEGEYQALYFALQRIEELQDGLEFRGKKIVIKGDSQGLLMQLKGEWPVYEENLNEWLDRIEDKINRLKLFPEYIVIPREENKEADHLAHQAIENKKIESRKVIGQDGGEPLG